MINRNRIGAVKHLIYYFTGTGNSLWAARMLAAKLDDTEIRPVLRADTDSISDADSVGLVFPVYMHRVPHLVADFIARLPELKYLYAVAVNAGDTGRVFSHFKQQLPRNRGPLKAGFSIVTPSNYLPFGEAVQDAKREIMLIKAGRKLDSIAEKISSQKSFFDKEANFFVKNIHPGLFYSMGYKYINYLDKNFYTDSRCTRCGICEKVCPVGNITLTEGKPVWNNNCQLCYGCINLCPVSSIQYDKKTEGLKRYINPQVTVADIINQK